MLSTQLPKVTLLSSPVSALPFTSQVEMITIWAKKRVSKCVFVANVHMLMEAYWDKSFHSALQTADLVTPDGMPLVWLMRSLGVKNQDRVAGLDILLAVCKRAEKNGQSIFFVGSTNEVLAKIRTRLNQDFPCLQIAGMISPPFRPLTTSEDEELVHQINSSGAEIIFVAFGCPKQENWMIQHRKRINGVMIGIGAAFPLYAGLHQRAPLWAREAGLEWLYRLFQEPQKLAKRYGKTIPPFILLAMKQLVSDLMLKHIRNIWKNS